MLQGELETLLTCPSESLARTLLDASPLASSIGIDGRIVYANQPCARVWRYDTPAKMLGLSFFDLIAPESHPTVISVWRARTGGIEPLSYVLVGLRSDQSRFRYRCTAISLDTDRGRATFAFFEELDQDADDPDPSKEDSPGVAVIERDE